MLKKANDALRGMKSTITKRKRRGVVKMEMEEEKLTTRMTTSIPTMEKKKELVRMMTPNHSQRGKECIVHQQQATPKIVLQHQQQQKKRKSERDQRQRKNKTKAS